MGLPFVLALSHHWQDFPENVPAFFFAAKVATTHAEHFMGAVRYDGRYDGSVLQSAINKKKGARVS
jgi:hypothetical protein